MPWKKCLFYENKVDMVKLIDIEFICYETHFPKKRFILPVLNYTER